jgi:hypothetical protein
MFLKELKCNLQSGEFVVSCDFAENYLILLVFLSLVLLLQRLLRTLGSLVKALPSKIILL